MLKEFLSLSFALAAFAPGALCAQTITSSTPSSSVRFIPHGSHPVLLSPSIPVRNQAVCIVSGVSAYVDIRKGVATTTLKVSVYNPNNVATEAEMLIPVPDGAVVKGMAFAGKGSESTAKIMAKEEALKQYREIVARMRDPSIMEFVNSTMIRSAVFPVEAKGKQIVSVTYEQVLPQNGGRRDYVLPRSESLEYKIPWDIFVTLDTDDTANVYSPSHKLVGFVKDGKASFALDAASKLDPGAFILSYADDRRKPLVFMYPDPRINGGYFMIVGSVKAPEKMQKKDLNELILVLDHSGSMRGKLIKQVREAAKQTLGGLDDGVFFNIIMYNEGVDVYSKTSIPKNEKNLEEAFKFIDSFNPGGGTNINDALVEALIKPLPPSSEGHPERIRSAVLFLTDGIPTIGQIRERTIRDTVRTAAERSGRTVFTFGVGTEVNAPLLDKIAEHLFGRSTYVLPDENIEVKVAESASRIQLTPFKSAKLEFLFDENKGKKASLDIRSVFPHSFGGLYPDEQLVILGEYHADSSKSQAEVVLRDIVLGRHETPTLLSAALSVADASTANAFVPRLWAARRIAELTDAVRELGVDGVTDPSDPKVKELTSEIVKLSIEYGILSEFTAYFAAEGSLDITSQALNAESMRDEIRAFEMKKSKEIQLSRSGAKAVTSAYNNMALADQSKLNRRNVQLDSKDMNTREQASMTMNQMDNQSFVRNGRQWTQGAVINTHRTLTPDKTVEFGSKDYDALIASLAKEKRLNALSLHGEILLEVDGCLVLVRNELK